MCVCPQNRPFLNSYWGFFLDAETSLDEWGILRGLAGIGGIGGAWWVLRMVGDGVVFCGCVVGGSWGHWLVLGAPVWGGFWGLLMSLMGSRGWWIL